jgi:hypothetical protein
MQNKMVHLLLLPENENSFFEKNSQYTNSAREQIEFKRGQKIKLITIPENKMLYINSSFRNGLIISVFLSLYIKLFFKQFFKYQPGKNCICFKIAVKQSPWLLHQPVQPFKVGFLHPEGRSAL